MPPGDSDELAIVVCTRNRPDDLARCLPSVLGSRPPGCRVVVVDQSHGDDTARLVRRAMSEHDDVVYVASGRVGVSAARNQGFAEADRDIVLFTDDDCEVDPGWAEAWRRVFDRDPRIGIGFGPVTAPPVDPKLGFIPQFDPGPAPAMFGVDLLRRRRARHQIGMGANMAVRRRAWRQSHGFDECLGAGSRHVSGGEETDIAIRMFRAGYLLAYDPEPLVIHHGYRAGADASWLARAYAFGTGVMYAKHIRCGDPSAPLWALLEAVELTRVVVRNLLRRERPLGFNRVRYFGKGLVAALGHPIDRSTRTYVPAD